MALQEFELCDTFMQKVTGYGWTCYPETSDWDILLVRDNVQIGVQAKTHMNLRVIEQCLDICYPLYRRGPHFRAVLVPRQKHYPAKILGQLKLLCFSADNYNHALLREPNGLLNISHMDWRPITPCWLPDVVPQVIAGASSPIRLTKWKQSALQLLALARTRGYITTADMKALRLSPTIFTNKCWLTPNGAKTGRHQQLVINESPGHMRPDQQHPEEFKHYLAAAEAELSRQ